MKKLNVLDLESAIKSVVEKATIDLCPDQILNEKSERARNHQSKNSKKHSSECPDGGAGQCPRKRLSECPGEDSKRHSSECPGGDPKRHSGEEVGECPCKNSSKHSGEDVDECAGECAGENSGGDSNEGVGEFPSEHSGECPGGDPKKHSSENPGGDSKKHSSECPGGDPKKHSSEEVGECPSENPDENPKRHSSECPGGDQKKHSGEGTSGDSRKRPSEGTSGDPKKHSSECPGGDPKRHSSECANENPGGDSKKYSGEDFLGHLSTNALLISKNRVELKEKLLEKIKDFVENTKEVNAFLNFFLRKDCEWSIEFKSLNPKKIIVEFSSPNPTGPLHGGHLRGIFYGSAIEAILKEVGNEVVSESYINDQGKQVEQFVKSIEYHLGKGSTLFYKGSYVKDVAEQFRGGEVDGRSAVLKQVENVKNIMKQKLGVVHDNTVFESSLNDRLEEVIDLLKEKNLTYEGILEESEDRSNQLIVKIEELHEKMVKGRFVHEGQPVRDKVLRRGDGTYTYFAYDLAYSLDKAKRADFQVCVLGEDHSSHLTCLSLVLDALKIPHRFLLVSTVHFFSNNERMTMSKREGSFLTVEDLLKHTSLDDLKWSFFSKVITRSISLSIDENLDTPPLFLVKNTYKTLQRNWERTIGVEFKEAELFENLIFKYVCYWPKVLRDAYENLDPHRVCTYLYELAKLVHNYFPMRRKKIDQEKLLRVFESAARVLTIDLSF